MPMCAHLCRQDYWAPCSEETRVDSEPTSVAAFLGTEPRPPLTDPAPQKGEAYGNIKLEWLLMGPWEHTAFSSKERRNLQSPGCDALCFRGRAWEPGLGVLTLSCGAPASSLISLCVLVWTTWQGCDRKVKGDLLYNLMPLVNSIVLYT